MNDLFPAAPAVPGQAESATAYQSWLAEGEGYGWWADYLSIREEFPYFKNWRIWVYIAWATLPEEKRIPKTEKALASEVLHCTTRSIRGWKAKKHGLFPNIEEAIAFKQSAFLMQYRQPAMKAMGETAATPGREGHADRKLLFEMLGDYTPRSKQELDVEMPNLPGVIDEAIGKIYGDGATDAAAAKNASETE